MKIVLAYSGGLDTSIILRWLKESASSGQAEIIAFCADIGQQEELDGLEAKALKTGASKCIIEDLREEFARDFIFPMFQAGAIYEGRYLLGTSIARPLIAKRMEFPLKQALKNRTRWIAICSTSVMRAACWKTRGSTRARPRCARCTN